MFLSFSLSNVLVHGFGLGNFNGVSATPTPLNTTVAAAEGDMETSSNTLITDSDTDDEMEDSSDGELGMSTSTKARRPTLKNPYNGLVEGVKRGNAKHSK